MPMQWNISSKMCVQVCVLAPACVQGHMCIQPYAFKCRRTISLLVFHCFLSLLPPSFLLLFLTHSLRCATDGRVAVSGALLVSLDLLPQSALHAVTTALYQVVSSLLQACQAIFKARYFLHDSLWKTKQPSRNMLARGSWDDSKSDSSAKTVTSLKIRLG